MQEAASFQITRAIAGTLLVALLLLGLTLVVAALVLQAPRNDIELLALFLGSSGIISLLGGTIAVQMMHRTRAGIRLKLLLASLVGLLIAFINIVMTSLLMFINQHDLSLLLLLIGFAGLLSFTFVWLLAGEQMRALEELASGAHRIADGDLQVRLQVESYDEIGSVATALNTLAMKLDLAAKKQHEMEEARKTLMAAIAHDLRTPITSIRAMTEAVLDGIVSDAPTTLKYLTAIRLETQTLNTLIDDLFELSQIDAGVLHLEKLPVMLDELGEEILNGFAAQADRQEISVNGALDPNLPPVAIDKARFQRVINNLLQNALRHTAPGGMIELEIIRNGLHTVRICVSDTGEGVNPADIPHLFERFYRGEKSRNRATGGAGLGLAIARELVEAHGGQLWYEPNQPQGSRFCILLPC